MRLTDEHLADILATNERYCGLGPSRSTADGVAAIARELTERRAMDLSPFESMVLKVWRDRYAADDFSDRAFVAVLTKLLKGGSRE